MRKDDEERFREFARGQTVLLRRCAYLLSGDWHLAEDLVQTTLIKMYRAWPRIQHTDRPVSFARTTLTRCWLDERRRPWRRSEAGSGVVPDIADPALDPELQHRRSSERATLLVALAKVPPRQRAVLVLRYFEGLTIAETAAALGCSDGTVKSQAARGLDTLRVVYEAESSPTDTDLLVEGAS
jgi:RNA polymerase sigma-70 factor (sigma-E family)